MHVLIYKLICGKDVIQLVWIKCLSIINFLILYLILNIYIYKLYRTQIQNKFNLLKTFSVRNEIGTINFTKIPWNRSLIENGHSHQILAML